MTWAKTRWRFFFGNKATGSAQPWPSCGRSSFWSFSTSWRSSKRYSPHFLGCPALNRTPHFEGWGQTDRRARLSGISYLLASGKTGDITDPWALRVFYSRICLLTERKKGRVEPQGRDAHV